MVEPRRRFRFLKELAEGAFGKVYMAEMITAEGFSSVVAVKLLHGKWAGHQEIAQRSRDEARLLGLLHHRNIVRVEDLTSINNQCAVIMEYLEGVDLKTLIAWCRDHGVRLPRRAAFEITSAIAGALDSAYNQVPMRGGAPLHVIHRDIKPSNVMVTAPGDVKVLDFGTARANFEEREAKTQALAFGSQAYMAPERLLGDPDGPSGDVFSLGVNLYELLTYGPFGKIFIRAERYENALDERMAAVDLSDLSEESAELVRDVLRRMLAYDASTRPSAGEVVDLMDNLSDVVNDGGLQRFCRQVVRQALESVEPVQNSEDPLTGSTLFEDRNSGAHSLIPEDVPAHGVPASPDTVAEDGAEEEHPADSTWTPPEVGAGVAQTTWAQGDDGAATPAGEAVEPPGPQVVIEEAAPVAATSPAVGWRPPELAPPRPPEPPVSVAPPVAPPLRPVAEVPRPVAKAPPPPTPAPAAQGGGKGKLVIGVVLGLLLVVGGVGAALLLGGDDEPTTPPVTETPKTATPAAKLPPGGRYEIAPMDGTLATLRLTMAKPAPTSLTSTTGEFKQEWDGTGTLELVGIPAGSYRTRIEKGGDAVRATLKLDAGKTCTFAFDASKGEEWEAKGCE